MESRVFLWDMGYRKPDRWRIWLKDGHHKRKDGRVFHFTPNTYKTKEAAEKALKKLEVKT